MSLVCRPHTWVYINRAEQPEHKGSLFHALRFQFSSIRWRLKVRAALWEMTVSFGWILKISPRWLTVKWEKGKKISGNYGILSSLSHLCFCSPPPPPSHPLCFHLFPVRLFPLSGGRFGAEEGRSLVVYSTLHSTACLELVKCIPSDLLDTRKRGCQTGFVVAFQEFQVETHSELLPLPVPDLYLMDLIWIWIC